MRSTLATVFSLSALRLTQAVDVYLYPNQAGFQGNLLPDVATSTLSHHLGLEQFEPFVEAFNVAQDESFIASAPSNVLLLTLDEEDVDAILPDSMRPSFKLETPSPISSLSSVVSTYLHRARHVYDSIFDSWSLRNQRSLADFFKTAQGPAFAAIELSNLVGLRQKYGRSSDQYKKAAMALRTLLEEALDDVTRWRIAVLTFESGDGVSKRSPSPQQSPLPPVRPPPQEPIGSVSTCFATQEDCEEGTETCSGRGQCVGASKAGKTCFVCTCKATKTGKGKQTKTYYWVGQSCERKDVSGPFVLLAGTTIVLILLIAGSISLLYAIGNIDLPSTLLGTAVITKKD